MSLIAIRDGSAQSLERHLVRCRACHRGAQHFLYAELTDIVLAAMAEVRQQRVLSPAVRRARAIGQVYCAQSREGARLMRRQLVRDVSPRVLSREWYEWYDKWWRRVRSAVQ